MKNKLLLFSVSVIFLYFPNVNFAQAPNLGESSGFVLFTGVGELKNTGQVTSISGNIGTNAGAYNGFLPGTVNGAVHLADSISVLAAVDVNTAYTYLASKTCDAVIGTTLGSGQVLTPKVYCLGAASTLEGNLILDAQGDPNALFIFKIDGAFSAGVSSTISLINSASLCNVYWQVNGAFSLSNEAVFNGTLIANGAINLYAGSKLYGRALTRAGAISLDNTLANLVEPPVASTITAGGATTFCFGNSVMLSGNNGGIWNNLLQTPTNIATTSGDYFVTNTTACGSVSSNHIIVQVDPLPTDFGDLLATVWPIAGTTLPSCKFTGIAPSPYNAVTNPFAVVWAGNAISQEPATIGGGNTSASTDDFDDGLGIPSIPLHSGYTYNFTVNTNANLAGTQVYYRMWFDWNNDGNFANDQSILVGSTTLIPATYAGSGIVTTAGSPVTIVVPVKPPYGASPNYKVRLLVSDAAIPDVYRANSPAFVVAMPNGEVEDYNAPAVILPINFGKVSAEVKNCNVYLAFETLTELNNKQFEVEYSTNGSSWKTLAVIPGKGNSSSLQSYSYIHNQPASEYNYYRIKQVDKNGNFGYSSVVTVRSNCAGAGAIVSYPNPIRENLSVVLPSGFDRANIKLVNAVGQSVATTSTTNGGIIRINTNLLPKGVYMLQVLKEGITVYNQKVIKD